MFFDYSNARSRHASQSLLIRNLSEYRDPWV